MMLVKILLPVLLIHLTPMQDATSEAKSEIASKYALYDRAMSLNDAARLLQFYSNETSESYAEEIKGRAKRSRTQIQEDLGIKVRASNKVLDALAIKGHRTAIKQFRLGEGIAVVRTEEKTSVVRQQSKKSAPGLKMGARKINEVTVTSKMEIWYHTSTGWKLENTRVINRALVATYAKPAVPGIRRKS